MWGESIGCVEEGCVAPIRECGVHARREKEAFLEGACDPGARLPARWQSLFAHSEPTVDAAAKALNRFEVYTKHRDFSPG
jgi:hypothetical protein